MKTKANCPVCNREISLLAGVAAPTPFHLRCPHCRAKLRIRMEGLWPFLMLVVCLFTALALGCVVAWKTYGLPGLVIGLVGYAIAVLVVEIISGMIFYTYGTLIPRSAKLGD